ncbi:MAG: trigger factor [bacterium]|nr:MAG: trigger factor [bacterium]
MEVNIAEQGKWERIVEVTVPYEEMTPRFNEAYLTYKKKIHLEGFRKGKVPVDLIKKVFGVKIEKEVAENSVSDYLKEAVKEKEVKLYDISKLESVNYDRTNGLQFKAVIKIQPDVAVEKYKNLDVEKEIYQVTDDDIREAIENLREQNATMTNIEGEAQRGHYIVADIQKTDSAGLPIIGEKHENQYFQLSGEGANESFVEQLIGVKPGDTRRIILPITNPDANSEDEQNEYYSIAVKEVKEKMLPEVDDDLAIDIGNYKNLEELKEAIRKDLEKQAEENTKQNLSNRIMDEVLKTNPIELPDYMIENFLDAFIENVKKENREKIDEQELRERYRTDAIWSLKWIMIKDKILEIENINIDEKEVIDYIEDVAKAAGKNAALIRTKYRDSKKREQLMHKIQERKVVDLLLDHAKITDKIVTYRDRQKAKDLIV